ncbi:2-carboxy-1,4-naphthoquinone phytyltransferase, chloroplastic-like [Actinidia eriantha]|uniref:2-carboxy-1,4-naphthoquinone phytyltransferase, chloroplastic-like n=1 Tax=Actinidia eriantha TaxID=165200 RepID=UPI00258F5932|nr:2-carboxy-1,4-naphthoquinone phytyltransferase, chloroplastic-like [Actinidia eriantha]XP_057466501.1 2-carboxy-1,4-naphthoquinone phytyltransferase, chloroplastic-like [Actinidia eriantha]XP_057466502.1 2-carboxy-1,4-naphthoquinone phytyltransferase, chloroplastic-like [Actinidia eriantha]
MASAVCNLIVLGSSQPKLCDYSFNQRNPPRPCQRVPFSYPAEKLLCCCHNTRRYLNRTPTRGLALKRRHRCGSTSFKSGEEHPNIAYEVQKEEDISRATLIWRAIKLPIYFVALVPLAVGGAAAYLQTGLYSARRFFVLLASSVLIITWLNLSNDVYDFDTGADKTKKESVVNIVGSRKGTLLVACMLLALGFIGLTWVSVEAGSMRSILLLACAITCGYIYQCPPFRLSYQGLGEPLCFAAFGPFATTAFYLLQSSTSELPITGTILSASLLVGFTTTLILFCSHFHQVKEDRAVGKMSPLVRLGTETGSEVVKAAVVTLYSLLLILGLIKALPFTCILLCSLTSPMGKLVVSFIEENHKDKAKIFMAKYYCVRLHALFGAALAAGLVAPRMVTGRYGPKMFFL